MARKMYRQKVNTDMPPLVRAENAICELRAYAREGATQGCQVVVLTIDRVLQLCDDMSLVMIDKAPSCFNAAFGNIGEPSNDISHTKNDE
jgi:hypothetical protein